MAGSTYQSDFQSPAASSQLLFTFYENCTKDENRVKGKCMVCKKEMKGNTGITSNFVSHLKVRLQYITD